MILGNFPFEIIDWTTIPKEEHKGENGFAYWQVFHLGNIRIRKVEYSAGYLADHWCNKGHIILCLEGEMDTELVDGRIMKLKEGMNYIVGDENEAHRTSTEKGCKLYIVD
jgi:quercetin dioxygenase-like cupin family protein